MAKDLGDFFPGAIIDFKFNTYSLTGAPITLAGTPALAVYKSNSTVESTAGIALTVDFDSRTGLHHVRITTGSDGAFYDFGQAFFVVLTAGTVDGVSVVGTEVATFTLGQVFNYRDAGVPQAVGSLTTTIRAAANFGANVLQNSTLHVWGSDQQYWVSARITAQTGDVLTHEALPVVPSGTLYYVITREGGSGTASIDAAGVRAAVGLATANLDTQLNSIKGDTAATLTDTATDGVVISAAGVDALLNAVIEGSTTLRQSIRLANSVLAGRSAGFPGSPAFRDLADTKNRVTASLDANGNRLSVVRDLT